MLKQINLLIIIFLCYSMPLCAGYDCYIPADQNDPKFREHLHKMLEELKNPPENKPPTIAELTESLNSYHIMLNNIGYGTTAIVSILIYSSYYYYW